MGLKLLSLVTARAMSLAGLVLLLFACSDGGSGGQRTPPLLRDWIPGEFNSSVNYRDFCANPRTGSDPFTNVPVNDRLGRVKDENNWLRSIHNELYLWFDEIEDIYDPADFTTPEFFELQITNEPSGTGSGRPKDNFHFALNTEEYYNRVVVGTGVGYGAEFAVVAPSPPREVVVAFVEPDSPATDNTLARGAQIISVDGEAVEDGDADVLNAGLFPATAGESHDFLVRDLDGMSDRMITMVSANVTTAPVQHAGIIPGSANVGYLLFNEHIYTAETMLVDAFTTLASLSVTDLVLDLRYNPGGLLDLASEVAYMIAGDATTDLTFERLRFNSQYDEFNANPFTGGSLLTPFHSTSLGFSVDLNRGDPLPTLNAENVVVITSDTTCSASEAIINGLRGTSINIMQVGSTTCGKPYGTVPLGNCGTTYFFTQFEGFNELDQGEYSDGFKPANAGGFGEAMTGCAVADDFEHELGDPEEENIAAALRILDDPMDCPAPPPALVTKPGVASKFAAPDSENAIKDPKQIPMKIVL